MKIPSLYCSAGLFLSALGTTSHASVVISDFDFAALGYTYAQWSGGTFTPGASNFRVESFDFGGGGLGVGSIDGTGCDTVQLTLDVNSPNATTDINVVLTDADGTQRVYRFSGLTTGVADPGLVVSKAVTDFLQDNAPGSTPGLDLANITGFDVQGTFGNGDPGLVLDLTFDRLELTDSGLGPITEIPNGDFEFGGTSWDVDPDVPTGTFVTTFPGSGGNPDGHLQIDHSANDGGFLVVVANDKNNIPLDGLGLAAGSTYTFSQDMRLVSGSNLGGLKVEFYNGGTANGNTGDLYPPANLGGAGFATYDFDVAIPVGTTAIRVVLLWAPGSVVDYDNVTFDPTPQVTPPITEIPDGGFDMGTTEWGEAGAPNTTFTYPGSGGNPGAYALMDNDGGGFGVLVSNADAVLPIDGLGLVVEETYNFSVDMRLFAGSNIGGMKIDFFNGGAPAGSTGDMFPVLIGDGTTWESYVFPVTLPAGIDGIKVVLLWGSGSQVGYDNVFVDPNPVPPPPITEIPNGDFEAGSNLWAEGGAPDTTFSYPFSGGNPGRYGVMTNTGGFGIWIANGNQVIPFSGLGMVAGETYTFAQDMIILSGTNVGGLKVDFFSGETGVGSTGDIFPSAVIGAGDTWETYEFEITLPANADGFKLVPLWGANSSVGYDNFRVIVPSALPFAATIKKGTAVSWTPVEPTSTYQAQRSDNGVDWANVGPLIQGDSVSTVFDPNGPAFDYRVIETTEPLIQNAVLNPGFESTEPPSGTSPGAEFWNILALAGDATIEVLTTSNGVLPNSGSQMLVLESTTPAEGPVVPPATDVRSDFNPVVGGTEYTLSFYAAHPVKIGGANPQFNLFFYDGSLNPTGAPIFESFASVGSDWTLIEYNFTAPANAEWVTVGWIQAMGAGNGWQWVTLIDDVYIPEVVDPGEEIDDVATGQPGVQICWPTDNGVSYQVETSPDLNGFTPIGPVFLGDGNTGTFTDFMMPGSKFYRVMEVAP